MVSISDKIRTTVVVLTLALLCGYAQASNVSVMIQQSPAEAGSISPGTGVHNFAKNTEFALTATPRQGYQFVYWLGEVSNPTSSSTTLRAGSPQIVIAVYERVEHDQLDMEVAPEPAAAGGAGTARASAGDFAGPGGFGGPGGRPQPSAFVPPDFPDPPDDNDLPIPGDDVDFPVPEIPEPSTIALLAAGAAVVMRRRRKIR